MQETLQGTIFKWNFKKVSEFEILSLSSDLNVSTCVAEILFKRGYKDKESARDFLFSYCCPQKHHPSNLEDAEKSVERIISAIKNKEKILICGDYDVDGISSTSLLLHSLLLLKANINFFLPNRIKDGYGLSKKTVENASNNNYKLIITVDNGISAYEAIKLAKEKNIDVIVTDHHQPGNVLPEANFIVNPHKKTCKYPFKGLAGVGVAFKLVTLIFEKLEKKIPEKIYELFLLGTIADMVPLVGENRYLVKNSLNILNSNKSYSIKVLAENAKILPTKKINSTDVGFSLAPQINALGRLEDPRKGVLFFINSDEKKIDEIGKFLFELNEERKKIEKEIFSEINKDIKSKEEDLKKDACILRFSKNYPPGIIGLVAGKICQTYGLPTVIFYENEKEILKGSARSIPDCNIYEVLSSIDSSLIESFGGHSGAAGIVIKKENFSKFKDAFSKKIREICNVEKIENKIEVDAVIQIEEINKKLWHDLELLEPFGSENPLPVFLLKDVFLKNFTVLKDLHIKATLQSGIKNCSIIFFNKPEWIIFFEKNKNKQISVLGKVVENIWKDESKIELIGIDIKF